MTSTITLLAASACTAPTAPLPVEAPSEQQRTAAEVKGLVEALGETTVTVEYQGQGLTASVQDEGLLVAGDILISWDEVAEAEDVVIPAIDLRVSREKTVAEIRRFRRWSNGVVPYELGHFATGTAGHATRLAISVAMAQWQIAVPGLQFVVRTTQTDYIRFELSGLQNICNAESVGRKGGRQRIWLRETGPCAQNPAIAHEIGHALGLFHAHQRSDAALFISSVLGCPANATSWSACGGAQCSPTGDDCGCSPSVLTASGLTFAQCIASHANWSTAYGGVPLGEWDRESIMHYQPTQFAKPFLLVFWTVPGEAVSGQSISAGDRASMRAMYPVVGTNDTFERDVNRAGGDLSGFWMTGNTIGASNVDEAAWQCHAACVADSDCLAFTVIDGGYYGFPDHAYCQLKEAISGATSAAAHISGIVRSDHEYAYDRPGSDLSSSIVANVNACRLSCVQNNACQSYTFVTNTGRCYRKSSAPAPIHSACGVNCTSGLVREGAMEYGVDRPGGDSSNFWMQVPDPWACRAACFDDPQCRAFTYVEPGVTGTQQARCWLKSSVPAAQSFTGVISGRR